MLLKSKEQYNVLISNEEDYLQIIDQGKTFKSVKLSEILCGNEIIINEEDD